MVITWLKWTCSSATSWQPQLSRVAAIVVKVDAAALEVCLAKRDRHLDENEKRYDHRTGQRIYGRFEVPDLREEDEVDDDHDDAGVDEGYRNVPWVRTLINTILDAKGGNKNCRPCALKCRAHDLKVPLVIHLC